MILHLEAFNSQQVLVTLLAYYIKIVIQDYGKKKTTNLQMIYNVNNKIAEERAVNSSLLHSRC